MPAASLIKRDAVLFALIFVAILILHIPLLTLPYFWDEAGHYIPAARDFMLSGDVIPKTTISNAHPPLPQFYLALMWSVFGYAPTVARVAMLLLSAFALVQVFRIGEQVANREVAIAATVCSALYPVIFAQSSLAHADLMAMALALWGLRLYLEARNWISVLAFSLAVLAKETAILFPVAVFAWEVLKRRPSGAKARPWRKILRLSIPAVVLALWFGYHYWRTGYIFGNPEFFRYNVASTFVPLRIALAALRRLWQVTGYMNLWVLTGAMAAAMLLPPLVAKADEKMRERIAIPIQLLFLALIVAHVAGHSLVGGAVLARYMMPVIPLVILISVSTLWRRVPQWKWVVGFVCATLVIGWFVPPLTSYAPEDNLNYASYVRLHQKAAKFVERKYPRARVLTAWPASDEIAHPYLGYVERPLRTVRIENFSFDQLMLARQSGDYDVAFLFSTKTPRSRFRWQFWEGANARYFDLHEDVSPGVAATLLGGRGVMHEADNGQWVAVVEFDRIRYGD
ncbi:MAG: glycosyltransferase family 39 protein [Terriglobales bacterium]